MGIILTIDCGTTSTRAIIFNSNQSIIYTSQRSLPLNHPQSDWVEQCPNDIWNLTNQCLQDALNTNSIDTISAIAITNQRETAIIWNKRTGEPIGPAVSWQCRRTSTTCTQLSEHASIIRKKTGLPLDPYFSATKLHWLLNYYPETKSLIENEDLCFGTVDTWLLWKLTN